MTIGGDFYVEERIVGWPFLSMHGRYWITPGVKKIQSDSLWHTGLPMPAPDGPPLLLPLRPIWPGFAVNTVFYAAILWLLFTALVKVRHWRRMKRGHCIKCNYDLRGGPALDSGCPECGWNRGTT